MLMRTGLNERDERNWCERDEREHIEQGRAWDAGPCLKDPTPGLAGR
jgi:hypothetical protein